MQAKDMSKDVRIIECIEEIAFSGQTIMKLKSKADFIHICKDRGYLEVMRWGNIYYCISPELVWMWVDA